MSENQEPAFDATVMAEIEALLFATDVPLGLDRIQALTPLKDRKSVRNAIEMLRAGYDADGRAFTVVEFGGGYSISTRPEYATLVRKLFKGRRKQRLTRASLEALAIVAYKQPVTRLEIEEIRGVAASGVLGTLLERDLIHIVGRAESLGHPLLYGTTRTLLDYLGLSHVRELPQLSELEDLLAEKEDLKQLAFPVARISRQRTSIGCSRKTKRHRRPTGHRWPTPPRTSTPTTGSWMTKRSGVGPTTRQRPRPERPWNP